MPVLGPGAQSLTVLPHGCGSCLVPWGSLDKGAQRAPHPLTDSGHSDFSVDFSGFLYALGLAFMYVLFVTSYQRERTSMWFLRDI